MAKDLKKRPNRVLDTIIRSNNARAKKDIAQWRSALLQAENVENPKRILLYNLYKEIELDADLTAEIEKRKNALIGSSYDLFDEDGNPVSEATKLIQKKWFVKFLMYAFDSKLWGHSLIEVSKLNSEGQIADVKLINRWHVRPEKGLVVKNQGDEAGLIYRDNPSVEHWLFEVGDPEDLGIYNKTTPHVLYQRFAQGAWSEFCELFGMPVRYAKTDSKDDESLNRLEQMMIDMATASYAIIDKDEELEFVETAKSDGEVYEGLMKVSSNKISKLINGAVLGEDSGNGSRSKEEVGLKISELLYNGDKSWLESYINEDLLPKLINLGYPFEGLYFQFNREKNLKAEWDIIGGILQHFEGDEELVEYINETFGVPVTRQKRQPGPVPTPGQGANGLSGFFD